MEMLFLGTVCVGLAIYILYLQNKVEDAEHMMNNMVEAMMDIADGKAKAVRTGDTGVKVVAIELKKEMLLS
jgi:hypothetical protein